MIIGIDPDLDKSGVAFINKDIQLCSRPLWTIFSDIHGTWNGQKPYVVIEAGWMNKKGMAFLTKLRTVKGPFPGMEVTVNPARRAIDVGRNHAVGQQIESFCKAHEIEYELFVPTARTPKWDHEMMCKLTGRTFSRSNQEERDALRAVYFSTKGKEVFK